MTKPVRNGRVSTVIDVTRYTVAHGTEHDCHLMQKLFTFNSLCLDVRYFYILNIDVFTLLELKYPTVRPTDERSLAKATKCNCMLCTHNLSTIFVYISLVCVDIGSVFHGHSLCKSLL